MCVCLIRTAWIDRSQGKPMMEMEPFPFFQEDPTAMGAAAGAMEELFPWDFSLPRGLSDLVSPDLDPAPPPEEDMLPWGLPIEEYVTSLGPPPPATAKELLQWATSPMAQPTAAAPPVTEEVPLPPPPPQRSAFVRYERSSYYGESEKSPASGGGDKGQNINRRVIEYLRKIPPPKAEKAAAESSRCFRHMMRERQRRERLSQSYADLHSLIFPTPKANKNAIVHSAAAYVRELKGLKESLQRRQQELRPTLGNGGVRPEGATTIKLRVGNPSSPIDSMIAALRQLKGMDAKARSIRSSAGNRELSAVIDVETKMAGKEVEKAVQRTLVEVEWNLRRGTAGGNVDPSTARAGALLPREHVA